MGNNFLFVRAQQAECGRGGEDDRPESVRWPPTATRRIGLQPTSVSVEGRTRRTQSTKAPSRPMFLFFSDRRAHSLRATTKKMAAATHLMIAFGRRTCIRADQRADSSDRNDSLWLAWRSHTSISSFKSKLFQIIFWCHSIASHVTDVSPPGGTCGNLTSRKMPKFSQFIQ